MFPFFLNWLSAQQIACTHEKPNNRFHVDACLELCANAIKVLESGLQKSNRELCFDSLFCEFLVEELHAHVNITLGQFLERWYHVK